MQKADLVALEHEKGKEKPMSSSFSLLSLKYKPMLLWKNQAIHIKVQQSGQKYGKKTGLLWKWK